MKIRIFYFFLVAGMLYLAISSYNLSEPSPMRHKYEYLTSSLEVEGVSVEIAERSRRGENTWVLITSSEDREFLERLRGHLESRGVKTRCYRKGDSSKKES